MRVFIRYSSHDAPRFRVAAKSWERRGWDVRILLPGKRAPKRSRVIPPTIINFAFKRGKFRSLGFGIPGWRRAPIVRFPDSATELDILTCGRAI